MKYKVNIRGDAKLDLKEIQEYLSSFGATPKVKLKQSFSTFIKNAAANPLMYPEYEDNKKYRRAVIEYGYLVFYTVGDRTVTVMRVLNDRQNVNSIIIE